MQIPMCLGLHAWQLQAPDEEAVPFKAAYALAFNGNLRLHIEPEYSHPAWNNLKSAIKHSKLQSCLLKATLMSHVNHGPYGSGKVMETKLELCHQLLLRMTQSDWMELRDDISWDRLGSGIDVPSCQEDLLNEPTIAKRGIFATWWLHGEVVG